ncbi:hypothetical protein CORC01_04978 [Colletotrichum orchidophilum]|uniref:Zn(2)-C6 fungal-type domain-containing protein n=1 Tax=Colletotrichum orchidophilum TaxID=1209926 RepID=A0A1G4BE02_9PEZI|nr:uncharacterized protein CORC01_04978 [Colletotrichum orchidophilum]OHE99620.1 hypothetical protein CORC01_04978 [Colletotrichum orchidophilum]
MPRPKVPESQRQRAAEACRFCREAKKKCSGIAPCNQCVRRGLEPDCRMTYLPRGSRTKKNSNARATNAVGRRSRASFEHGYITRSTTSVGSPNTSSRRHDDNDVEQTSSSFPISPSVSRQDFGEPRSGAHQSPMTPPRESLIGDDFPAESSLLANRCRLLRSVRGEQVFVGSAAAISFLQTVRQVVVRQIGPSSFSHNDGMEMMLEAESPEARRSISGDETVDLGTQQRLDYSNFYYTTTEGLIDVLDSDDEKRLQCLTHDISTEKNSSRAEKYPTHSSDAIRDVVMAIGAQCCSAPEAQHHSFTFFRKAQRQAFSGLLEDPDLDMVRVFLLMAFYMLGNCRRNTAYMYISIAARAALALGLHSQIIYTREPKSHQCDVLRSRVWISVRILDKLVSSLLGRPAATAGTDARPVIGGLAPDCNYGTKYLDATCGIVEIINNINNTLYRGKDIKVSVVEQLLVNIDGWKRDLFIPLGCAEQPQSPQKDPIKDNRVAIAKIHVSCLYYFAVTLATRPTFISSLNSQAGNKIRHPPLATACIEAAAYLAQTCADALKIGLLQRSMCILKALVFSAGLILGVECFAEVIIDLDTDRAFQGAMDVLSFLASQSPQAAHYLEILTSLANAIAERRSKSNPVERSGYVSRLFEMESLGSVSTNNQEGSVEDEPSWAPTREVTDQGSFDVWPGVDGGLLNWSELQFDDSDLHIDWQSLSVF